MTDLNTLSKLVIRTESMAPDLNGQFDNLKKSLELVSIAGGVLDQIKRNVYYGEKGAFKDDKLNALSERLVNVEAFDFTGGEMKANTSTQPFEINTRVVHGIVGLITEAAELADALIQYMETGTIDNVNLVEELADCEWYSAILQDELDFPMEGLYQFLLAKLSARYGEKFSEDSAVLRDIGSERDVMERFLKDKSKTV